MTAAALPAAARTLLTQRVAERQRAGERFFGAQSAALAALCHRMAERFARDGRLIALGVSPAAQTDARHVEVEFVHPVIVGKRALPALALTGDVGRVAGELALLAGPQDIVLTFGGPDTAAAVASARARGCLTLAFAAGTGAEHELAIAAGDPFVDQELAETAYHVLWELVHVFFEHRGLLEGRTERRVSDAGAAGFLYPFLAEQEDDLDAVLADVRASVLMKAQDVARLRMATVDGGAEALLAAGTALRDRLDAGGLLLALGNGGSATDAADVVADFVAPPARARAAQWPPRRALDLTAGGPILTAVANDIGVDAIFARQVIAYGHAGDALLALSTSGNSTNVLSALEQARRQGLLTIAFVGYDGGRVAAERLADHVLIAPSEHIPRIQEAQATAYHLLRELVERP